MDARGSAGEVPGKCRLIAGKVSAATAPGEAGAAWGVVAAGDPRAGGNAGYCGGSDSTD